MKSVHYRELILVGEGQFGKVYSARHRETGELVALKQFNNQKFSTKKFLKEIRILLSLKHRNIVSCLGVEHDKNSRYLVTEYCEGGTLRDLIKERFKLNIEQKLKIVADILSGLQAIHEAGIIHRDLKPENILLILSPSGWDVKISDFGVAKIEKEDKVINNYSLGDTGSPAYMAPEQFYGKYSYQSDIYAVGIILYEMLIGDRPFHGTPQEIMFKHLNKTPFIPSNLSSILSKILLQALEKLPRHRFRSAKEMRLKLLESLLCLEVEFRENNFFFSNCIEQKLSSFSIVKFIDIPHSIIFNSFNSHHFYCVDNHNLFIYYLNDDFTNNLIFNYTFNNQITDLKVYNNGCFIITESNNYNELYQYDLIEQNITQINTFKAQEKGLMVSGDGRWYALTKKDSERENFEIFKYKQGYKSILNIDHFFPIEIVSVDEKHGLTIFKQNEVNKNYTFARCFTKKGNWCHDFCFGLSIENIVSHPCHSGYLMGRESFSNCIVLIQLFPLKIKRIPLNFEADFMLTYAQGFICASHQGKIIMIDLAGNLIKKISLNFNINNIHLIRENLLLVIFNYPSKSRLVFVVID